MAASDEEFYTIPIKDQRVFGAGIKRKRINFVRATTESTPLTPAPSSEPTLAQQFLANVQKAVSKDDNDLPNRASSPPPPLCEVCNQPIRDAKTDKRIPHEATITHQIALQHSFGPSAIDRKSRGLPYMQAQGWDPDARQGLGASGEGMLHPIVTKEKKNRYGLGIKLRPKAAAEAKVKKPQNLNAKQLRKLETEEKKHDAVLRDLFYRDEKVETLMHALEDSLDGRNKSPKKRKAREPQSKGRWV